MAPITYKCCKNKELHNYCCVSCNNIFHKSCIERKTIIIIDKHKIYCSKKCAEKNDEKEINSLKLTIDQLNLEIKERDNYIKIQKYTSQVFEDDVIEIENHYNIEIKNQKEKIKVLEEKLLDESKKKMEANIAACLNCDNMIKDCEILKNKIKKLKALNTRLQKKLDIHELKSSQLQDEITELKDMKAQTEENIINKTKSNDDILTQTGKETNINPDIIEIIDTDLENIAIEENVPSLRNYQNPEVENQINVNTTTPSELSRKMLLLCDDYGRELGSQLFKHFHRNIFTMETIVKPGASFSGVIEDIESLTKNYTLLDYVVIVAGSNDFINRRYPLFRIINKKIKQCTHTNIIFTSVPYNKNKKLNSYIYKFNTMLSEYIFRLNKYSEGYIQLIDINNVKGIKKSNHEIL